jgi:hypothetical protein
MIELKRRVRRGEVSEKQQTAAIATATATASQ